MMRVISSPSISTTGVFTFIFAMCILFRPAMERALPKLRVVEDRLTETPRRGNPAPRRDVIECPHCAEPTMPNMLADGAVVCSCPAERPLKETMR
jgi:hypothetical protein